MDPIFVVHADHGEAFGEHGFYGHGGDYFYEENIHIPFLIFNADIKGAVEKPISLISLPTVLIQDQFIGDKKLLEDPNNLFPDRWYVISKTFDQGLVRMAIRTKEHKFILLQKNELYNLKKDPYERENIIGELPTLESELRKIAKTNIINEEEIIRLKKILTRKAVI